MKIDCVRTTILRQDLTESEQFGWAQGWATTRTVLLVELITDTGIAGVGEAFGPAIVNSTIVEEMYAPQLLGRDPFDNEAIWEQLYNSVRDHGQKGVCIEALSAVDIALWDIKGKATGLPVHKLLGGTFRDKAKVYATGLYIRRTEDQLTAFAKEASDYVAQGFRAVKMKIGYGIDRDTKYVKAVREAIGDDVLLMVDANCAYNAQQAIEIGRRLEEYGVYWFEEPVPPEDIDGYLEIKNALNMAIAGGEGEFTAFGFRDLISRRAVDIIQPDCCITGGLSEGKRIATLASLWNIRCCPHVWGSAVAVAAHLHFVASLPNSPASLYPTEPLMELDRTPNVFRESLSEEMFEPVDGYVKIPSNPGLGVSLNQEVLQRYRIRSKEIMSR